MGEGVWWERDAVGVRGEVRVAVVQVRRDAVIESEYMAMEVVTGVRGRMPCNCHGTQWHPSERPLSQTHPPPFPPQCATPCASTAT